MKRSHIVFLVIFIVLLLDQCLKIYIKTTFPIGGGFKILGLDWARIHFIENEGMAFGLTFGGEIGKYILSTVRIILVIILGFIINGLIKEKEAKGLLVSLSLITAGAIGNIIDSVIYGKIFSASKYHGEVATMFPPEGGYSPILQGKVVDMLYFPMINTHYPDWFPFWSGDRFTFFNPVFNLADASISMGIFLLLVFYNRFFKVQKEELEQKKIPSE